MTVGTKTILNIR